MAKVYVKDGLPEIDRYHAKFGDIGIKVRKRTMAKSQSFDVRYTSRKKLTSLPI